MMFLNIFLLLLAAVLYLYHRSSKALRDLRARTALPQKSVPVAGNASRTLRVLCQNMWCTNSYNAERKKSRGPRPRDRFDALVAESSQYDVLVLQELFIMRIGFRLIVDNVLYLRKQLVERGFVYHTDITHNLPLLLGQSSGVAVFSRWPIVECSYDTFRNRSLKDSLNGKGFVRATVEMPAGQKIHFFTVHMDSARRGKVRLSQIAQLSEAVTSMKDAVKEGKVLVAGDFNIRAGTDAFIEESTALNNKLRPLEDLFPHQSCDHIFVNKLASAKGRLEHVANDVVDLTTSDGRVPVSDHSGLSATFQLSC